MKRLVYLSVLPILGAFFMAFSVEKVVDYQEVEESSKYFKIVRGENDMNFSNIGLGKKGVPSILYLNKDKITLIISQNNISKELLNEAEKYFKTYGFALNHIHHTNTVKSLGLDNKVKPLVLDNIEINITENEENNLKRIESGENIKPIYQNNYPFQLGTINGSKRDTTGILKIVANRKDGSHGINFLLAPPQPPSPPKAPKAKPPLAPKNPPTLPVPPKPPLAPKAPAKPPVPPKLGLNILNSKTHGWDENKIANLAKSLNRINDL